MLIEQYRLGPVAVDRSYLPEDTDEYLKALEHFTADHRAAAQAWLDERGLTAGLGYRTEGGRRMLVWVTWEIQVGHASGHLKDHEWTWSDRWRAWRNRFSSMGYHQAPNVDEMRDAARDEAS